jgi:phosphoglycerate kinase
MANIVPHSLEEASKAFSIPRIQNVEVAGKTVLVRGDLNVPAKDRKVTDITRIERMKKTISWLLSHQAKIVLMSHFGRPKGVYDTDYSLRFLQPICSEIFGTNVEFVDQYKQLDWLESIKQSKAPITLLENLRFDPGEEKNSDSFAENLAQSADLYVNDAFSVSHRAHASVEAIAHKLPSYAGYLLQEEIDALTIALENPEKPLVAIVGGAKISTKLDLLNNMIKKVDFLILGGGMANTFLAASGHSVGASLFEESMLEQAREIMKKAEGLHCKIILPVDVVVAAELRENVSSQTKQINQIEVKDKVFDIGVASIAKINDVIGQSKTLLWNGPVGVFEVSPFDQGTMQIAHKVAKLTVDGKIKTIAGGGDTVAALNQANVLQDMTYVSSAGGAFLEWCEGKVLPGIKALGISGK